MGHKLGSLEGWRGKAIHVIVEIDFKGVRNDFSEFLSFFNSYSGESGLL